MRQENLTSDFKMPSIAEISFPKIKSPLALKEVKIDKKISNSIQKMTKESSVQNKIPRNYSMSLLSSKRDLKTVYSPVKRRNNPQVQNVPYLKIQKCEKEKQAIELSSVKTQNSVQKSSEMYRTFQVLDCQHRKQLNPLISQNKLLKSMYPTIKLQNPVYTERRMILFDKFLPGIEIVNSEFEQEKSKSARLGHKKPLFNGKFLVSKKKKNQLPDELIARKLVWDGKQCKKIDHKEIYGKILEKSKNLKNNNFIPFQHSEDKSQQKNHQFTLLSAWQSPQEHRQSALRRPIEIKRKLN